MKKRLAGILAAVALLSVVTAGIGKASAYFTTYAQARGGHVIELGDETTIEENFDGANKVVRITNDKDSKQAVWVRAMGITGAEYQQYLDYTQNGSDWTLDEDGFYVYKDPVLPGEHPATDLTIGVSNVPVENGRSVDVVVVYESTPAIRNDIDGTYEYPEKSGQKYDGPDWNADEMTRKTETVQS